MAVCSRALQARYGSHILPDGLSNFAWKAVGFVYSREALREATRKILTESLVHVGEPVEWTHEFRCFVAKRQVQAISPYVYEGEVIPDFDSFLEIPSKIKTQVHEFAAALLAHRDVKTPPAFVLDVGVLRDRGWAVVECNECWASGIYDCDPTAVLNTLLAACVPAAEVLDQWDFAKHYAAACAVVGQ